MEQEDILINQEEKTLTQKIKRRWEEIPHGVKGALSFIGSILTIIGYAGGIPGLAIAVINKIWNKDYWRYFPWIICILLFIVIMLLRKKSKQYKLSMKKRRCAETRCFYGLTHDFRNLYFDILLRYKKGTLNSEYLTEMVKNYLKQSLNELCEIIQTYTGCPISSCLKLIGDRDGKGKRNNKSFREISIDKATVYTFVRSDNIGKAREESSNNKEVPIKQNTDFKLIISPKSYYNKGYFYESDLHKCDKRLREYGDKYRNSTKNYWDFYRGTAVVPIRIQYSKLFFANKNIKSNYHIYGFLCVDSMSTDAFIKEYELTFINILKAYSAIMYIVLNKYDYYLKKCKSKDANNKKSI